MCSVFIVGDKALHQVLDDARKIAERCTNPADRDQILKTVGDIESMVDALCELRQLGKVRKDKACQLVNLTLCCKKYCMLFVKVHLFTPCHQYFLILCSTA